MTTAEMTTTLPPPTDSRQPEGAVGIACSVLLDTVFCGDNTEILFGFPAGCVDLVVTSPPYDNLRMYGGCSWNFETLAAQLVRVLKPGGVIVWVVADATVDGSETLTSMRQAIHFKDVCGLNVHDTMIYASEKPPLTHNRYEQSWEYAFVLSKGRPKTFNPIMVETVYGGTRADRPKTTKGSRADNSAIRSRDESERLVKDKKIKGNIWKYKTGGGHSAEESIAFEHPAIFPESLAKDHITSWSNPGDLVLDCFAGSGTTLKSAKQLNRRYVGIEINPNYVDIIKNRLAQDALSLGV